MKPAVAILAAGASARLGQCKALVELGGRSGLQRLLEAARSAGVHDLAVVTGAHHAEIVEALASLDPPASAVHNPRWLEGRTGSVAAAVARFPGRDLLVAPVDVPLVATEVFQALLAAWERAGSPARGWLAPRLEPGGRHGHPLVLGRDLAAEVPAMPPAQPLKLLRARADPCWDVPLRDPAILDDLDTPEDLERLRGRLDRPRDTTGSGP